MDAVFLSASVPYPPRAKEFPPADPYLIQVAVRAFVVTCLGRRRIVWGGHPAITPMIWAASDDLEVTYAKVVNLYQSEFFEDKYPQINQRFQNFTIVPAAKGDRNASLLRMREEMLRSFKFVGAAFIGGMDGVIEEFDLFQRMHPKALVVFVGSTGGAAQLLAEKNPDASERGRHPFDYYGLFSEGLRISLEEKRRSD